MAETRFAEAGQLAALAVGGGVLYAADAPALWFLSPVLVYVLYRLRRRSNTALPLSAGVDWPLVLLPTAIGLGFQSKAVGGGATLLVTLVAIGSAIRPRDAAAHQRRAAALPWTLLLASGVLVWTRGLPQAGIIALLGMLACAWSARRSADLDRTVNSALQGIGLYCLVSVLAAFAGLVSPAKAERIGGLTNSFTGGQRLSFPLASTFASPPIMACAYIAGIFVARIHGHRNRWWDIPMIGSALYIAVAANYRQPVVTALLVVAVVLVSERIFIRTGPWLLAVLASIGVWYSTAGSALASQLSTLESMIPGLSHGTDDNAVSSRDVIWNASLRLIHDGGTKNLFFGRGYQGDVQAGLGSQVTSISQGLYADSTVRLPPHSSMILQLFDGGIVGTTLWFLSLIITGTVLARVARAGRPFALVAFALVFVIVSSTGTEILSAPESLSGICFIPLAILVAVVPSRKRLRALDQAEEQALTGDLPLPATAAVPVAT